MTSDGDSDPIYIHSFSIVMASLLRQFYFSEWLVWWLYPAQTCSFVFLYSQRWQRTELCDPNGKQLGRDYLNILPKTYSLVHCNFGHRWHIRGKTVPKSMSSVGQCPKEGLVSRNPRLWLVAVQTSSCFIGLLWKFERQLSGFPLLTGNDWCLHRRKLFCQSQIENNINRFILGSFCLRVNLYLGVRYLTNILLERKIFTRIHR